MGVFYKKTGRNCCICLKPGYLPGQSVDGNARIREGLVAGCSQVFPGALAELADQVLEEVVT